MQGINVLSLGFKQAEASGIGEGLVVVTDSTEGYVKLPSGANVDGIIGVTTESQTAADRAIAVRITGVAKVKAAGVISYGARVNIAGSSGKVKAVDEASTTKVYVVGRALTAATADGDLIDVLLQPGQFVVP